MHYMYAPLSCYRMVKWQAFMHKSTPFLSCIAFTAAIIGGIVCYYLPLIRYTRNLKALYQSQPEVPGIEFLWYDKYTVKFISPVFHMFELSRTAQITVKMQPMNFILMISSSSEVQLVSVY